MADNRKIIRLSKGLFFAGYHENNVMTTNFKYMSPIFIPTDDIKSVLNDLTRHYKGIECIKPEVINL